MPTELTPEQLSAKVTFYKDACAKANMEVCQTLGAALGMPRFCDDQANFPGSTEEDGVCVGEHVAETLAMEAARRIAELEAERAFVRSLETSGADADTGTVYVQINPRGVRVGAGLGAFIDKAMEDSAHVAHD